MKQQAIRLSKHDSKAKALDSADFFGRLSGKTYQVLYRHGWWCVYTAGWIKPGD